MNEIERIKEAYQRRKIDRKGRIYSYFNEANLFMIHQRERRLLDTFRRFKIMSFSDRKILDVGCGGGGLLRELVKYGARPENLCGIDLLEERIEEAKHLSPNIDFRCGDASSLPYNDGCFNIVIQFTLFTSILDITMKKRIASEMLRVLKPDGIIIWYDFHRDNPRNPDVRGVKKEEIFKLFPDCTIYLKRVTLAPPIARILVPFSVILCELLEKFRFLCTHYLGVIRRKKMGD
jgi:ubiquinone/menaquinone biosynthesis C-methylase UbiE